MSDLLGYTQLVNNVQAILILVGILVLAQGFLVYQVIANRQTLKSIERMLRMFPAVQRSNRNAA